MSEADSTFHSVANPKAWIFSQFAAANMGTSQFVVHLVLCYMPREPWAWSAHGHVSQEHIRICSICCRPTSPTLWHTLQMCWIIMSLCRSRLNLMSYHNSLCRARLLQPDQPRPQWRFCPQMDFIHRTCNFAFPGCCGSCVPTDSLHVPCPRADPGFAGYQYQRGW